MKSLFSYTLTVVNGETAGKEWRLFQDVVTLGRHDANHLVFTNATVSKKQCRILSQDGALRIENLSQSNKTRLNDVPVDEAELADGDVIQMGDVDVRVSTQENQVSPVGDGELDEEPATAAIQFIEKDAEPSGDKAPVDDASTETGSYTIESKIAQSGQAILFKGRDDTSGESVALKLFTHDETDEVSEARFRRELKILRQLSHKNIVGYRGLFETEGEWGENKRYLVMEYLEGKTLKELIEEHPKGMEWGRVQNIFEQCLLGLIHASKEHDIIHRDIKPSNIFILDDGTVKLIDFGISRFDSESTHTGGSGMMGSFDCMAPDFALAEDAGFRGDMVSDIFSLFVCLYHSLTGTLPYPKFGERQELEYLNRWRGAGQKPPSHKHIAFRVIAHLGGFIDKGLSIDASKRYRTYDEVFDALRKLKNRTVVHKKVDSYEFLSGLGVGGFGEVYLGKRESDEALVAIKRLHSGHSSKRFIKEATILSQYEHPAIVKYLDFFETASSSGGRSQFLVLECLVGTTLGKQIAEHSEGMDTKEVLQLFLRYLSALDFLHNAKRSIIHRDIKPANLHVPLDDPSKAKLFDLGIIKDLSGTQTSGKLPGTYYYMAPEMFTMDNRGTSQTDVYAMGLCLYEALTGAPAFPRLPKNDKEAIVEMIARAQGERPYRVSYNHRAFRDHPDLVHLVQMAINSDPNARYSDAKRMWEDIASVLELQFDHHVEAIDEGVQSVEQGSGSGGGGLRGGSLKKAARARPAGRKRRKKGLAVGLGVAALVLVGAILVARAQLDKVEPVVDSWPEPVRGAVLAVLTWTGGESLEPMPVPDQQPTEADLQLAAKQKELEAEREKSDRLAAELKERKRVGAIASRKRADFDSAMNYLGVNQINYNSYATARTSVEQVAQSYTKLIETKFDFSDDAYIRQGSKGFWAGQLGSIVKKYYERDNYSLKALANGTYLHAMQRYAKIMGTDDIAKIQEELAVAIAANTTLKTVDEARRFFPVLQGAVFAVGKDGGTGVSAWWSKYAPDQAPGRFPALYLPQRAEGSVSVFNGETRTIKMDYVLVPFNMVTEATELAGSGLEKIPINPFYMAAAETTLEQMGLFWSDTDRIPSKVPPKGKLAEPTEPADPLRPYSHASLEEAIGFCNWLNERDGLDPLYEPKEDHSGWNLDLRKPGYRLPFDFEWEYAARFGYDFFPKAGGSDWNTMREGFDAKVDDQAPEEEINSGLVNFYNLQTLRTPQESSPYPLGMYDLCGNAPEICMTVGAMPKDPDLVEIGFIQMRGGKRISYIKDVAPWLGDEEPDGVRIKDKNEAEYGFRVIRTVPVHLFE